MTTKNKKKNGNLRFAIGHSSNGAVDKERSILFGVAIIEQGEAAGHSMFIDDVMLDQVVKAGNALEPDGTRSRFGHRTPVNPTLGKATGRFHNFRREGDIVRADKHLLKASALSPTGNYHDYILATGEQDPGQLMTSIDFKQSEPFLPNEDNKGNADSPPEDSAFWFPHVRLSKLKFVDIVEQGAATTALFSDEDEDEDGDDVVSKFAEEHPGLAGKLFSLYDDWKNKREDNKMEEQLRQELALAVNKTAEVEVKLATANEKIVSLEAGHETALTEAKTQATADAFATVAARVEQFEDKAFVLETIAMSDDEAKTEFINRVKAGKIKSDGEGALEFDAGEEGTGAPGAGEGDETFEGKVADYMLTAKKTKAEAISFCVGEYKELHEKYIKQQKDARNK